MDEIKQDTRKVIKISRKKFVIFTIIIVLVSLAWWVLSSFMSARMGSTDTSIMLPEVYGLSENNSVVTDYAGKMMPYPGGGQQVDITDTREFLKTNYSATIKTRDVAGVMKDVKNSIAGADGRVDSFYSSEKSGRVSFVVAKSKFEAFRSEIESLTYAKLYTENISSQNLLSQKQSIEGQTTAVLTSLESLQKQKENLDSAHNQSVNAFNKELARIRSSLASVRINITEETDSAIIASLRNQENIFLSQEASQKQKLNTENSNYSTQSQNLVKQIANANSNLDNVNEQDNQFVNNIETVSGYVSVNWVSLWEMAKIFSPISPVIIIIVLIIIGWVFLRRKGYIPKIVLT